MLYEVKGLHSAKVWVYEGVFDDRLVVVDRETGEKYEVENFTPLVHGEFKASKETPHEIAVKEAKKLGHIDENGKNRGLKNTLHTEHEDQGNLVVLPPRVKETRKVNDPLDVDTYSSITEAVSDFITISGIFLLDQENREAIKGMIKEKGMSRKYVRELALEVQAENERSVNHG